MTVPLNLSSTSVSTVSDKSGSSAILSSLGLDQNPYFSAGAGLVVIGVAASAFKQAGQLSLSYLQKRLFTSLEVPSKDPSYPWLLEWLSQQEKQMSLSNSICNAYRKTDTNMHPSQGSSHLSKFLFSFRPPPPHVLSVKTSIAKRENGSSHTSVSLVPGIGKYFIQYQKSWIQIERTRDTKMIDLTTGSPWETITLKILSFNKDFFQKILDESRKSAMQKQVGKTVIYTSYGPEWRPFGQPRRKRDLNSVILQDNLADRILQDVRQFLDNEKWYYERAIPYRRGYLLYGEPGTGKTSFIQALAGELNYNVCVMNLSERGMTDDRLAHLLSNTPPQSLLLLEDIDAVFHHRTSVVPNQQNMQTTSTIVANQSQNLVTFSGLLNALDGIASAEERLIFMTTNHIDRLDLALIRPGRVDAKYYISYADDDQVRKMFTRFYPNSSEDMIGRFVHRIRESAQIYNHGHVSPAQLQGHFVIHRNSAQDALSHVDSIFKS